VADVNADGKPDLVVANDCDKSDCNNGTVGVLINHPTAALPDFKLSASPDTITISAPGNSGSTTITITTDGNLDPQSVTNWICSGLPAKNDCTFGNIDSNNQVSLNITTKSAEALQRPMFDRPQIFYAMLLPGLLSFVCLARPRLTMRRMRLLAMILFLGFIGLWIACGGSSSSSNHGTPTESSTVTVSATSGTLQRSTTITLIVQ
jgi:hypothetical protein